MLRWTFHRAVLGRVLLGLVSWASAARAIEPAGGEAAAKGDDPTAKRDDAARREGAYEDAWAWYLGQKPERAPPPPRPSFHADRIDVGGLLVPQVTLPILVTDPFRTDHAGAPDSRAASVGYGLEWRLGYAFGGLSVEGLGGFGRLSREPLALPTGTSVSLELDRVWFGGQLRETFATSGILHPFVGLGGAVEYWSIDTVFRPNGSAVRADAVLTPSVHLLGGAFVRIAKLGDVTTLFAELGGKAAWAFAGEVSDAGQAFLTPYVGLSLMGARTPRIAGRSPGEAARSEREAACKAGDARRCRELARDALEREVDHRAAQSELAVDQLTQQTVRAPGKPMTSASITGEVARAWLLLEVAALAGARRRGTMAGWESFLVDHPHSVHVGEARERLFDLELAPLRETAIQTRTVEPILAFAEGHPQHAASRRALVAFGLEGRSRAELLRIQRFAEASDPSDEELRRFGTAARDLETAIALADAERLAGRERVLALREWREGHPWSSRLGEVEAAEADLAFDLAKDKKGSEAIEAWRDAVVSYPSAKRAAEAKSALAKVSAEQALATGSLEAMARFLEEFASDSRAPRIRAAYAALLLQPGSPAPRAAYEKYIADYPSTWEANVMKQRLLGRPPAGPATGK